MGQGLLVALVMAGAAQAASGHKTAIQVYTSAAEIEQQLPAARTTPMGVVVRANNGVELELTEKQFLGAAPVLCWYVPSLHVVGACEIGHGAAITVLINLNNGRRVTAPGLPRLTPQSGLIAVGPRKGIDADSITLVRVTPDDLEDQGGAFFDHDHRPGAWIDAACYRLGRKGDWLEKTPEGWRQVTAAQSTVCRQRHGG
jgi:hypothetical protein